MISVRTWAAPVAAVLGLALSVAPAVRAADDDEKPIKALFVCGGCCHDYKNQSKIIPEGISARANVEWTIAYDPDTGTKKLNPVYDNPDWSKGFDVIVHDECDADVKDLKVIDNILMPHKEGLPSVVLHCGMHCYRSEGWPQKVTPWFEFTGLQTTGHGAQLPIAISFIDKDSAITKGLEDWTTIHEELYNNIAGKVLDTAHPLARGKQGNDDNVCVWTNLYNGKTKVFATTIGHNNETCSDPKYLDLVTRGLLWSVGKLDEKHLKPAKHVMALPAPGTLVPQNLALGKPATASTNQDDDRNAAKAFDGDDNTRWCASSESTPQWLQVDLQTPQDLTGAQVTWEHDADYQYKVEGSADAQTWTTLADVSKGNAEHPSVRKHPFKASQVRYIRLNITGTEGGSWPSVFELAVLGTKMVPPSTAGAVTNPDARSRQWLAGVKAPKDWGITLFAAPTDVDYPVSIAAAPDGSLFVACDENGSLDQKPDRGRVVRCIDSTGSGVADQFEVFAKMDSPRGTFYDGSNLFVLHPPFLTVYHDDNGKGPATSSKDLITGLAHDLKWRGADHTTNGIQMGIDGWIYIAAGDYGAPKAVGTDGTELVLHGGGVLRVRPDGSGLEVVARGTRNIVGVAVDSLLNVFTCDNTNDGDAWNVRLNHIVPTSNYGYPSLFVNFNDEIQKPLIDYGDGSPTGILSTDESSLPAPYDHALLSCEWDFNTIFRHLLEPSGSSYAKKTPREKFLELPRPTDVEVDGRGHVFAASWKNAVFTYTGPQAGFVARFAAPIEPTKQPAGDVKYPDLKKSEDAQLVDVLRMDSHFWRIHASQEILHRGDKPVFDEALTKLINATDASLPTRVAALFTLRQLRGTQSHSVLLALMKEATLREYALRALTDDKRQTANVPSAPFVEALKDPNARVRLQAVIGLNRLGKTENAAALMPLLADSDSVIQHATIQALIALHATDATFAALDSGSPSLALGAGRVLQAFHEGPVVDGLISRMDKTHDGLVHQSILEALCRLYYREGPWTGDWWGTRPDTSGPYFKNEKWDGSDKIEAALKSAVDSADPVTARFLITRIKLHKILLPNANAAMAKLAATDPEYRAQAVDLILKQRAITDDALPLLTGVAKSTNDPMPLRVKSLRGLMRADSGEGIKAGMRTFALLGHQNDLPAELSTINDEYTRDGRRVGQEKQFAELASNADPAMRELGYRVLLFVSESHQARPPERAAAAADLEKGWSVPLQAASLLTAIGQTRDDRMAIQVRAHLADADNAVKESATYAAGRIELDKPLVSSGPLIPTLKYDDVVAAVTKDKGDPGLGAKLFIRQGCVACHTVSPAEPPKGPFLGDAASKYSRAELTESVMKPSAKIAQGFATNYFKLKSGTVVQGFIVKESAEAVDLRDITGITTSVPLPDVVKRGTLPTSVMPEGLSDNLTVHDLASIFAYLDSLKK